MLAVLPEEKTCSPYSIPAHSLRHTPLPAAAVLTNRGCGLFGEGANQDVVNTIHEGRVHIAEPDADTFLHAAAGNGRLAAHLNPQMAGVLVVAVPTPLGEDRGPDLSSL